MSAQKIFCDERGGRSTADRAVDQIRGGRTRQAQDRGICRSVDVRKTLNRRVYERYPARPGVVAVLFDPAAGKVCPARVLELSQAGLCLAVTEPLRPGNALKITLTTADGLFVVRRQGIVRYGVNRADGAFLIGFEFNEKLGARERASLGI